MKLGIKLFLSLILFSISNVKSQDPIYSMGMEHQSSINPSLIGRDGEGNYRFSSIHRNLYRPLRGPLFSTDINFDYSFFNTDVNIGLNANQEMQGDGFLETTKFSGLLGLVKVLKRNSEKGRFLTKYINGDLLANVGFKFGLQQQKINWDEFVFSDQLNPIYGNIYNSSNDYLKLNSKVTPDIGFGFDLTNFNTGKSSKNALNLGFAVMHIGNNTQIGLINDFILPKHYTYHFSWINRPDKSKSWAKQFQLMARYDKQGQYENWILRGNYHYFTKMAFGAGYRISNYNIGNLNSVFINFNFYPTNTFSFYFSYEFIISGRTMLNSGNTIDLGLILRSGNKKAGGKRKPCPVFISKAAIPMF